MPISNITRTNTVDEWRIQTNLSANSLNRIETGNYDKTAGSLNIACTAVLSITSSGTGLSVANNALVSGDFTVGRNISLGSESAATGNLTVGANTFIYGRGAALFVANSAIVNVSLQATESIRTRNFTANNDASITGTAQIGLLTVNTSTAIGTTLDVTGNTTVGNLVTANSVVGDNGRFTSNIAAAHFIAFDGSLVANNARISANATFSEATAITVNATNVRVTGNANVAHVTAIGSLVADSARIAANATFGEATATTINATNARISGNANAAHVTIIGSVVADSARIAANATFGETTATVINASNARISGNANVTHLTASGSTVADSLRILSDANINSQLIVTGNTTSGNLVTANMMYAGTMRTVGRADVGGAFTVGGDSSVGGRLSVAGDFVVSGTLVYSTDTLTLSTITPITSVGSAHFGVFRGNTTGGVTGANVNVSGTVSDANAYIRWSASSNTWQIRDVFNPNSATSYSKILTANLISSSLSSTSTDTFLSSAGAKSLKDSIDTEISDRAANVGAARIAVTNGYQANTGAARLELLANTGAARIADQASAQANTGAGLISLNASLTNAYQANVGAARIADRAITQANVGAGLISTTSAYQANVGAGLITVTNAYQANVGAARLETLSAVSTANTNMKNYVDTRTTNNIGEGTNLYYTDARVRAAVSANGSLSYNSSTGVFSYTTPSTSGISEGTNLYFTNARARAAIGVSGSLGYNSTTGVISYTTPGTDGISEGSTNLYYTNARARAAVGVAATFGAPLNYISANGAFQHLNSGVTASTYGSASSVPVFTVNATGHITSVTATSIAISSGAVSGLAASATTNALNATNINTGTLAAARLPFSMNQAVATSSYVLFSGIDVGTGTYSASFGEINAAGNITAGYSDDRLKNRLGKIENALDKVAAISGFFYEANETAQELGFSKKREVGVSAQDVQAVLPEVVVPAPVDSQYLTVQYDKLIPLVIEAIKELKAEIEELKKK